MAEETKIIRIIVDSSKAVDNTAAATRALEKLERQSAAMGTTMDRIERSLASVGSVVKTQLALMIAELGLRFLQMGKDALKAVAGLDELSEQLGVTTKFLQASQFAAVQSGVKLEQLETAYSKFSQKMGEAADGSKEMVEALDKLGVKNLDIAGKLRPTEALMQDVAQAIISIEEPAKRSAAAVDFFGKAGARMLPMLADIAAGSDIMAQKAAAAGTMIDESVIKALDKLADQSEVSALKFRALVATIGAPIATEAMEAVNNILGKIIANLRALGAMRDQSEQGVLPESDMKMLQERADFWNKKAAVERNNARTQTMAERANTALQNATKNAGAVENPADRVQVTQDQYATQLLVSGTFAPTEPLAAPGARSSTAKGAGQAEADRIDKLNRDTAREVEAANAYAAASERGAKAVADLEIHFKALKAAQDAYGATADKNKDQVAALTAKLEEQMKAIDLAKNLKDFNLGTVELEKANELLAAENGLINANVETRAIEIAQIKLKQELQAKGITADSEEGRRAIERRGIALETGERLKAQGEEIRKANELWTAPLKSALESIQRVGADAFEQMLTNGTFTFQSLGETFKKIVIRMAAEFMALATIRPVMTVLLNAVSPGMASTMGVGGGGGMPSMGGFGGGMSGFELPSFLGGGTIGELMAATPFASAAPAGGFADIGALMASGQAGSSAGLAAGGIQGAAQGLSVGSMMGAGLGIGMGAYSLATANGNTGKTLGGIGQMIGGGMMLIPGMQIPGMIVSMASSILPMLFGGEAPALPPLAGSNFRFDPGAGGYTSNETFQNGGASNAGNYGNVGARLNNYFSRAGGLTNPGNAFGAAVWNNQREGTTSTYEISPTQGSNQLTRDVSGDPSKAIDAMIARVFYLSVQNNAAMKASPTLRTAFNNRSPENTAQIDALLDLVDAYDQLGKVVPSAEKALNQINAQFDSLTAGANMWGLSLKPIQEEQAKQTKRYAQDFIEGMTDPMAVEMRALEDQRKDSLASAEYIRDNVKDVAVDIVKITEYWNKKQLDVENKYFGDRMALALAFEGQIRPLIRRLTYGDLANASPDTSLSGTRGTYNATLAQARAGNADALSNLSGVAEAYATSSRSYFASSAEYTAIREQITRDLEERAGALAATSGATGSAATNNDATNAVLNSNAELRVMFNTVINDNAELKSQVAALVAQLARRA